MQTKSLLDPYSKTSTEAPVPFEIKPTSQTSLDIGIMRADLLPKREKRLFYKKIVALVHNHIFYRKYSEFSHFISATLGS